MKKNEELYLKDITVYDFYPKLQKACVISGKKNREENDTYVYKHRDAGFCIQYIPDLTVRLDTSYLCPTELIADVHQEHNDLRITYCFKKEKRRFRLYVCMIGFTAVFTLFAWGNMFLDFAKAMSSNEWIMAIGPVGPLCYCIPAIIIRPYQKEKILSVLKSL